MQPVPERLYKSEKGQTMKHKIIFATGNEGKMREARLILADLGFPVLSMKEAQASCDVEENGSTFAENAAIMMEGQSRVGADRGHRAGG